MGEMIELTDDGRMYLATPSTPGPGVIVVQEWWGLNDQMRGVCDRLAAEGFTAAAPDLYRGEIAEHDEMDKANKLMSEMPMDRALRDLSSAIGEIADAATGARDPIGVVGFCMGGALGLALSCQRPESIGAVVSYYGAPLDPAEPPDWSKLATPAVMHVASDDQFFPADAMLLLGEQLQAVGKDVTVYVYDGARHAFANETNALGTYDSAAADMAWSRTLSCLRGALL